MIIDFHVHCFPDQLAKKTVPLLAKEANVQAKLNGTVSHLKKSMRKTKINHSVIQSIATNPRKLEK